MNLRKLLCGMLALCLMLTMAPVALMEEVAPEEVVIDLGEDAAEGGVEIEADALEAVDAYSATNPQKLTIYNEAGDKITKKTLDVYYDAEAISDGLTLTAVADWKTNGKYQNATDVTDDVLWTTSNKDVATVDAGVVTLTGKDGKATIKAIAGNGKSASVAITVTDKTAPKKVTISGKKKVADNGTIELTARVSPVWPNSAVVTWKSADTSIATVSPTEGSSTTVTGVKAGKVKITATTYNGKKATVTIEVTDSAAVTKVQVVEIDAVDPETDGAYELYSEPGVKNVVTLDAILSSAEGELEQEDAMSKYLGIEWKTSNKDKATWKKVQGTPSQIDVTLQGTGRVTLTAKSGKKSGSKTIDIVNTHACKQIINLGTSGKFYTGETIDLYDYFAIASINECWDKVSFKAHHSSMVDIDSDGLATFNKKGNVKIDVKCGGKKKTLTFKVVVDE